MKVIHWFREDLRLLDNPALSHAAEHADAEVVPVFIYPEGLGGASYWWLHKSLENLSKALKSKGVDLVFATGSPHTVLPKLAEQIGANLITWNRVYSPEGIEQGKQVKQALGNASVEHRSFNGQLLIEPTKVLNKQGLPFKVFTPFWRNCVSFLTARELAPEPRFKPSTHSLASEHLQDWGLQPTAPNWAKGFEPLWQPGEAGAQSRWREFLSGTIDTYKDGRDIPSESNTSLLSPHLVFGEISSQQLWNDVQEAIVGQQISHENGHKFLSEIGWREFSRYLLVHFPHLITEPFNARFTNFPWGDDAQLIKAWQQGQTGYPIVDAGMRELWQTGYMHNRVRMIVASFLTKHCLSHWHHGMAWFWDTLLDADIANNTASWQWVAGCGADASPYFRIFNPILQGEKFDKQGVYVKRWVPELADVPAKFIHKPWEADQPTLHAAKVALGTDYPLPIVDHKHARETALLAYQAIKT